MSSAYDVLNKIFSSFSLVITVSGTILNLIVCTICLRKRLRSKSTFQLMAFISLSDLCALYEWNFLHFVSGILMNNEDPNSNSLFTCKLTTILQFVTLQYSAWMLVLPIFFYKTWLLLFGKDIDLFIKSVHFFLFTIPCILSVKRTCYFFTGVEFTAIQMLTVNEKKYWKKVYQSLYSTEIRYNFFGLYI